MHILLTNDDGPPSPSSSPYISHFVRVLTSPPFNHTVTVVVPTQQRSWIGKAHLLPPSSFPIASQKGHFQSANEQASDCVTPSYYNPEDGTSHHYPPESSRSSYWVTAPGTPATCVQLALFHHSILFPHLTQNGSATTNGTSTNGDSGSVGAQHDARKCPFDLIISGPNFGRNTTAAFALSSGTIGGALEGAVCGVRAIALSFAFYTRQESAALIEEASTVSVRLIERLCRDWDAAEAAAQTNGHNGTCNGIANPETSRSIPDLYSINVPLVEGVSNTPLHWTWMLANQWATGSLYKFVPPEDVSEGETNQIAPSFKWAPNFGDMWKTIDASPDGNDGRVIREKHVSVTPLKANFQSLFGFGNFQGELKL